jgi:glycosyltransferase involved in cell wall biosynthesis
MPVSEILPEENLSSEDAGLLSGVQVVVMTSGHEVLDGRIYAREACSLRKFGADVTVVGRLTKGREGEVPVRKITPPSSRLGRFLLQPWRCLAAARDMKPDIVHFHDAELLAVLPVARLVWRKAAFVYDVHEDFGRLMRGRDWLPRPVRSMASSATDICERLFARLAHGIVSVTAPLGEKFPHHPKVAVRNFVPESYLAAARNEGRPSPERDYDLIHLGTLNRRRAGFLIEVLKEFHKLKPTGRSLVLGGSRDFNQRLREAAPEGCEIKEQVLYQDVPRYVGNAKVGLDVHPWLEPHLRAALAVKVCEYIASGCAVVASFMPVLEQVLEEAQAPAGSVKIIHGDTPAEYADAVLALVEQIDSGKDFAHELSETAARGLSWDNEARRLARFYQTILKTES